MKTKEQTKLDKKLLRQLDSLKSFSQIKKLEPIQKDMLLTYYSKFNRKTFKVKSAPDYGHEVEHIEKFVANWQSVLNQAKDFIKINKLVAAEYWFRNSYRATEIRCVGYENMQDKDLIESHMQYLIRREKEKKKRKELEKQAQVKNKSAALNEIKRLIKKFNLIGQENTGPFKNEK